MSLPSALAGLLRSVRLIPVRSPRVVPSFLAVSGLECGVLEKCSFSDSYSDQCFRILCSETWVSIYSTLVLTNGFEGQLLQRIWLNLFGSKHLFPVNGGVTFSFVLSNGCSMSNLRRHRNAGCLALQFL